MHFCPPVEWDGAIDKLATANRITEGIAENSSSLSINHDNTPVALHTARIPIP